MNRVRPAVPRLIGLASSAALLCGLLGAPLAAAQDDEVDVIAQPVVQPIPGSTGMKLNDALGRLARNPQDVAALIGAGRASMAIGDLDAAVGFLQRADRLSPGNAQVKAGLAGAYAQSDDPLSAIPLFAEAEQAGVIDPGLLADRGLAYDLVGDNAAAQKYYRSALAGEPNDETVRRLALSQAIAGDRRGMEMTLSPLLQRQDKAAWRTRAFGLAILGRTDEADSIVRSNLPANLAESMSAYVRYMPRLTAAQQAAAANLGHFPRAADIGRDDPRIVAMQPKRPVLAAATPQPPTTAAKGAAKDKAKNMARRDERQADSTPRSARTAVQLAAAPGAATKAPVTLAAKDPPPVPDPAIFAAPRPHADPSVELQPLSAAPAPAVPPTASAAVPAPVVATVTPAPASAVPGFDLKPAAARAPAPAAAPAPSPAPAPRPRSLADVFADLTPPSREAEPVAGAVDIRRIGAVRPVLAEKPAKDAKGILADECAAESKPAAKGAKGGKPAPAVKGAKTAKAAKPAAAKACPVDPKAAKAKLPAASQPSRIWVQLATGRVKSALAFDWRKLVKENPEILGRYKAATSAWGQNTRLLAGPFDSESAANAVAGKLKKAGLGGTFVWTSPAGQVVDPLGSGK